MSSDDLAQYGQSKAEEIRDRRERRRLEHERATADGKLKAAWGPQLWEETREEIQLRVDAVNQALGESALVWDGSRADFCVIRVTHVGANLSASYDVRAARVILTTENHSDTFDLEVVRGEVKFKAVGYFSPSQIAKMLVDKAASLVL